MKKYILIVGLLSIFITFKPFLAVGDDGTRQSLQDDKIYRLLNADHKKGLNEFNVLKIELGQTSREDIERIFGQPRSNGKDECVYQNVKVNGLYALEKKLEYATALPLMIVVGFPELQGIPVDEHPEAYDDYQYLVINFTPTGKVKKVVYKHFKNVLFFYLSDDGKSARCYTVDPPLRAAGWRKCPEQELLFNE
jgi:hypothetical protein